jgi:hypothetical protein
LATEDFNDTSRWLAIDLDSLVDVAAAAAVAGHLVDIRRLAGEQG